MAFWGVWLPSETGGGVDPEAGVGAGIVDGPGALGRAKGVDCGCGVGLGDGATDGVFAGGDCVAGLVGLVEAGGGVCAHSDPARPDSAASAESKRTPAFNVFPIVSRREAGVYGGLP